MKKILIVLLSITCWCTTAEAVDIGPAQNPAPISGDVVVTRNVTVSWDPGSDPNNLVLTYKLHTDAYNAPADPNLYLVADIANTGARASYELAALPDTKLISWRVDEVYDSGVITGVVWNFKKEFIHLTEEPVDMVLWPGATATFSTTAIADETQTLFYQWFKYDPALPEDQQVPLVDGGDISGVNTPDLSIANVQIEDEGQYVCAIFTAETYPEPVKITRLARLTLKRMIAHWTFDDDSLVDGQYQDLVGTYHTTRVGPTFSTQPGIFGQAIWFKGTASNFHYLRVPNTANDPGMRFEYTNMCTVAAWIKTDNMTLSSDWTGIVTKGDNSWQLSRQGGGSPPQMIRWRAAESMSGSMPVDDDNWHLLVGTFDRTSSTLYVDGMVDAQVTSAERDMSKNTAEVWIGNTRQGSNIRYFRGLMDDVRIYNYALTHEEVAQLYYEGTGKRACIYGHPQSDLNGDCQVDLQDLSILALDWLTDGFYPLE